MNENKQIYHFYRFSTCEKKDNTDIFRELNQVKIYPKIDFFINFG